MINIASGKEGQKRKNFINDRASAISGKSEKHYTESGIELDISNPINPFLVP